MVVRIEREHSVLWNQCYVLIHFIANILSKTSFPVYCLFVFACLFFLLWQFFASSYSLFISQLQSTETGSKDEHSKNKSQNINCYKSNKVLCMLSRLCVSNGTRCLSSLVRQKWYFALGQSWLCYVVMSEKVAAPCVSVFIFKHPYLIPWRRGGKWGGGGAPYNNLYGEVLPNRVHLSIQERLFHVLFFLWTFDIEKLSSWHHWKERP